LIDFILGVLAGGGLVFAYFHFKGTDPSKTPSDFLSNLEAKVKAMISEAMTAALGDLKTAIDAIVANAGDAAVGSAVDAKDAEDVQAVRDFTASLNPPA